ncbi:MULTISPECIES: hypothetical protein [Metallosphaera]|uniref:Uncharacterized protein n=1 Tax=Metallosphaera cuprina (strain Ar-4) TaxID=1006006 RepID=F4G0C3_METCR|nr:hypothetical protein [Metallosphaera cuprina]AEB95810.1 conserved hypothetical protein [Metallosphaera cuprina Ar-4]
MDRMDLLGQLLAEHGIPPKGFEIIERGTRVRISEGSHIDLMESGIILLYVSKRIPCWKAYEVKERIKRYMDRLASFNAIAGIEISDQCLLSLLRKLNVAISLESPKDDQLSTLWREYVITLKIVPLLTGATD